MTEPQVFVIADQTLLRVVEQIKADQWTMHLPDWFQRGKNQDDVTLRELLGYHAYDEAWVPDMLAGRTMDEVGPNKYDGDLLGDEPKGRFRALVEASIAAARALDDLERTVHTSFGDFSAREYLWQANSFRGLRARDIARVIGVAETLPPELIQGLQEELSPHMDEWRAMGVFWPEVKVPADASPQDKLMGMTGRQP